VKVGGESDTGLGFYVRVARQYARIGWIRKSQFRWEFVNQVVMDLLYYLSFVLTFEILYGFREGLTLAGWTRADILVFLGLTFLSDAFMMTWLGQSWHFGDDLKAGNLDAFRLRPGPVWFTYTFQRFSPEGLMNLFAAAGLFVYGAWAHPDVGWHGIATLPLALGMAAVGQVALVVLFQSLEFWAVNADLSRFFGSVFSQIADRPLDVYPRLMKRFFVWVLPLGALSWFPTGLVLGHHSAVATALYVGVVALFLGAALVAFRAGMRRYESAMS